MVDGGAIARIVTEQRGVRAVQRRDDARLQFRREHGLREDCRRRVRHGVMDVEHVQPVFPADLRHPHRKRQGVIGIFEQLIFVDDDGMKMQSRRVFRQPERAFVAEEMDFMSAPRQILAQGGGENAAAADSRVTGDADFHIP